MIVERTTPYLKRVEKFLRPRFSFTASRGGEKIVGIFSLLFACSIAIPLPLTNFIPAIGITLMSLGLLSKDGVVISVGMLIGTIGVFITTSILILGPKLVIDFFSGLF